MKILGVDLVDIGGRKCSWSLSSDWMLLLFYNLIIHFTLYFKLFLFPEQGKLPAGAEVYISMYNYHRNEEFYPQPDVFNPDRFLPENTREKHPFFWIPFGLGMRSCVGKCYLILSQGIIIPVHCDEICLGFEAMIFLNKYQ